MEVTRLNSAGICYKHVLRGEFKDLPITAM